MKKLIIALLALFTITVSASAMSYNQARDEALFLTDKMAYELNLTDDQYEAAYEINLDYLMDIDNYDDLYGTYWLQRNLDLANILLDWQYQSFINDIYFYRPIYWDGGYWHFRIYARYPHRNYFYFGRPDFITVYRGGHSWRMNGGRSWYVGHNWRNSNPNGTGMRDGWDNGNFGKGARINNQDMGSGRRSWGGMNRNNDMADGNRTFDNMQDDQHPQPNRFGNRESSTRNTVNKGFSQNRNINNSDNTNRSFPSFGGKSSSDTNNRNTSNFGNRTYQNGNNSGTSNHAFSIPSSRNSNNGSKSSSNNSHAGGTFGGGHR